jgi:hypothetical protein
MAVREYGNRNIIRPLDLDRASEVCLESSQISLNVCPTQNLRNNSTCTYTLISAMSKNKALLSNHTRRAYERQWPDTSLQIKV